MHKDKIRISRVDHIALTVADAEAVAAFYTRVFGARELYRLGPMASSSMSKTDAGEDWTSAYLGVPNATLTLIMLQLGDDFGLEIFQYDQPKSETSQPPPSHRIGSCHIGLEVTDLDVTIKRLRESGCTILTGPIAMESGPVADKLFHYFRDPFGNTLELVSNRERH